MSKFLVAVFCLWASLSPSRSGFLALCVLMYCWPLQCLYRVSLHTLPKILWGCIVYMVACALLGFRLLGSYVKFAAPLSHLSFSVAGMYINCSLAFFAYFLFWVYTVSAFKNALLPINCPVGPVIISQFFSCIACFGVVRSFNA